MTNGPLCGPFVSLRQALLSTTPSVLSGAVSRLEARLGWQLLQRTIRRVGLTDAGRLYRKQVRTAFGLLGAAERDVQGQDGALAGPCAPERADHLWPLPAAARAGALCAAAPAVRVELNITNRNVDLVAEGFDLAIRLGQLPDSGLVARKPEDVRPLLVAAPDCLQRCGTPQTLEDLQQHLCVPFVMPRTGRLAPWIFRDDGRDADWLPRSSIGPPTTCSAWCRWPSGASASARATGGKFDSRFRRLAHASNSATLALEA